MLDGVEQPASAHITVTSRDWSGETVDFGHPVAADDPDMDEYPYKMKVDGKEEEGYYHLGHIHYK